MSMLLQGGLKLVKLERKKLVRQAKTGEEVDTSSLSLTPLSHVFLLGPEPPRPAREDRKLVRNMLAFAII